MSTERPAPGSADDGRATPAEAGRPRAAAPVPGGRRRRLALGAVALAVLLAGGGGAYLATAGAGGGSGAPAATGKKPPQAALDDYASGADGPAGSGIAAGEPDPNGPAYRAEGDLPRGPGEAAGYRAGDPVTAGAVRRLARALGLAGEPGRQGASWQVGSGNDGSGPLLRVGASAPGSWTYSRLGPGGGDNCPRGKSCSVAPDAQHGTPVDEAAARKAAAPVLKALGESDAALDATRLMGSVRVVEADPVVAGLPTQGWATTIRVGPDGTVSGGSGRLAEPVKGDTYPVLGAGDTLDRLNAARRAGRHGEAPGGCASAGPEPSAKDMPCAGPAAPRQRRVEKAVFGLAAHYSRGLPALVPSWLFRVAPEGGGAASTVAYPAVTPDRLGERPDGTPLSTEVDSYTTAGHDLTVRFEGGVCADYSVSVRESGKTVAVSVHESGGDGKCVAMARQYERTVRLAEPLGARTVVDSEHLPVRAG